MSWTIPSAHVREAVDTASALLRLDAGTDAVANLSAAILIATQLSNIAEKIDSDKIADAIRLLLHR